MSFNIKNSFVSRSIVEHNEEHQIDDGEKKEEVVQEKYDPRTLYERLQEQKAIKEEKFAEESRLSNQIKRMDEEEIAFYKTLSDEKEKLEYEQKIKEKLELEEFRQAVDSARSNPTNPPEINTLKPTKPKVPVKSNKRDSLKGALFIKKKRDKDDEEEKPVEKKQKIDVSPTTDTKTKATAGSLSLLSAYGDVSSSDSESD